MVIQDITERHRIQEALQESESFYRGLFSDTHVVLLIDPESGRIVDANPAASAFYGYPPEALRRMTIFDVNTLDEAGVRAKMKVAAAERRKYFVFCHRRAEQRLEILRTPKSDPGCCGTGR